MNHELGSSMKSVGEVLAIGRTFEETIQKGPCRNDAGPAFVFQQLTKKCKFCKL